MKIKVLLSIIGAAVSCAVCTAGAATDKMQSGRVYVLSNKPDNSVLVFNRACNGSLTFIQEAATQGAGNRRWLTPEYPGNCRSLILKRIENPLQASNA